MKGGIRRFQMAHTLGYELAVRFFTYEFSKAKMA
jgi:hypothetical protein